MSKIVDEEKIAKLYDSGMSLGDIAKIYRLTPQCIHKILKKTGYKPRYITSKIFRCNVCGKEFQSFSKAAYCHPNVTTANN